VTGKGWRGLARRRDTCGRRECAHQANENGNRTHQ
jgi:hypothetical protein